MTPNVADYLINQNTKKFYKIVSYIGISVLIILEFSYMIEQVEPEPEIGASGAASLTRMADAMMLLMNGVNPMFVADQRGHSLQILIKRYTKWLHGDKNKLEIAKLSVACTA